MAQVQGIRQHGVNSGLTIPNILKQILMVDPDPNLAGFLAFFAKVMVQRTLLEQFKWETDTWLSTTDTIDGAVTDTSQTSIKVDNVDRYIPGQLWFNTRTLERMLVNTVNISGNLVDFVRQVTALNSSGGTAAAVMNDEDTLAFIAPILGEDHRRQQFLSTALTEQTNFCQIAEWAVKFSERDIKREFETGAEMPYQMKKTMNEAKMALDRLFLFGNDVASSFTRNGQYTTGSRGIWDVPTTNVEDVSGTLTLNAWEDFLAQKAFRFGSRFKIGFCGMDFFMAVHQVAMSKITYQVPLGTQKGGFGIQVMEIQPPTGGRLMLVEDRNITALYPGDCLFVELGELKRRVFSNNGLSGDLEWRMNTEDNDDPGQEHHIHCDMGLQWGREQHLAKMKNVEGGPLSAVEVV